MLGFHMPTIANAAHELERAGLMERGRRKRPWNQQRQQFNHGMPNVFLLALYGPSDNAAYSSEPRGLLGVISISSTRPPLEDYRQWVCVVMREEPRWRRRLSVGRHWKFHVEPLA
jgi:hypothetical protein